MLEKIKKFLKEWGLGILMILVLFKSCGTNSNADKAADYSKETTEVVDSLSQRIVDLEEKTVTEKQVRDVMEEVMLDFLVYEDELDKHQITISAIKERIKAND